MQRTSTVEYARPTRANVVPYCIMTLPVRANAGNGLSRSTTGTSPQFDDIAPNKLPATNPDPSPAAILVGQSSARSVIVCTGQAPRGYQDMYLIILKLYPLDFG